jgi:uncharacterized surface protein with fasciclin (FAS1) repeats
MSNITQVVKEDKYLTTLNRAVTASGLDEVLSGPGPFTLFAPSDLAFGKLDGGVTANLLKAENKLKLIDLLNHHVVADEIEFKDLKEGEKLKTINGKELSIHIKNGKVSINGAIIQQRDVKTSNGVIHSLDTVLKN